MYTHGMIKEEKEKRLNKKQSGITLIALVVTIVVLIMLASITIIYIMEDNSILKKAQEAKAETRAAAVEEEVNIWKSMKQVEMYSSYNGTTQTRLQLLEDLVYKGLLTNEEKNEIEEKDFVTIEGKTIEFGKKSLGDLFDLGKIQIGDYINYPNPASGEITISAEESGMSDASNIDIKNQTFDIANNQLNWQVLGKDENTEGLKLIAAKPIKRTEENPYFYLYGAKGYVNAENNLNKICALYKNNLAQIARSVTVEDINQATGASGDILLNIIERKDRYNKKYEFKNQYTPESWIKKEKTTVEGIDNGYWYSGSSEGLKTYTDTVLYNLLFYNTEAEKGAGYWLASRCVYSYNNGYADFHVRGVYDNSMDDYYLFISDGRDNCELCKHLAVRPVIVLKSNLTLDNLSVIESKNESIWNYTVK